MDPVLLYSAATGGLVIVVGGLAIAVIAFPRAWKALVPITVLAPAVLLVLLWIVFSSCEFRIG